MSTSIRGRPAARGLATALAGACSGLLVAACAGGSVPGHAAAGPSAALGLAGTPVAAASAGLLSRSAAGTGIADAQAAPPGLLLRGERATLTAFADSIEGGNVDYTAYVRASPKTGFTRLAMHIGGGGGTQWRIPARFLTGRVLEDYVVVRDPRGGQPVTVPPAGARAPFRSWIVSRPVPVALGTHTFGRSRKPQAVVATAQAGTGPGQVGFYTPKPGETGFGPSSFDVARDGTVWVADRVNSRLLAYAPGRPRRPERAITMPQEPLEVALAPSGTIYVLAGAPLHPWDPRRVYAFAPDGTQLWAAPVAGVIYNDLMRVDRDGILWIEDFGDAWLPVTGSSGHPLTVAQQTRHMAPYDYQPIGRGLRLVDLAIYPTEDRIGLETSAGTLLRSWRVTSRTAFQPLWPQARAGRDIVEIGTVGKPASGGYELEFLVVRFSPAGRIIDRFAVDARQSYEWDEFTRIRVGLDGHLYYLQTSPKWGMRVARYQLRGAAMPPGLAPPASAAPSRTSASPRHPPGAGTSYDRTARLIRPAMPRR